MTDIGLSQEDEREARAFMARVARLPHAAVLRDAGALWWKSQLLRRWDAQRRAQRPLDVMERVEILTGLTAAATLLAWVMPDVVPVLAEPLRQLFS